MEKKSTFYEILGLNPDVSSLEIKHAYRRLVKNVHPDTMFAMQDLAEKKTATERMAKLNEAYETLKDRFKRAHYDSVIGANGSRSVKLHTSAVLDPNDTDHERERYLSQVFHPARQKISKLLNRYKRELGELSQDIYDDQLLGKFEVYVTDVEGALLGASQLLSSSQTPTSLRPAELMMRYAIAQAADGLEEMSRFCQSYDYDHLGMAGNLFREYAELARKALQLTKQ
jgi:hypothetical protein